MEALIKTYRLNRGIFGFGIGVAVFLLTAVLESSLRTLGIRGIWEWADNGIGALVAGTIVYLYERRIRRSQLARLRVIAEMNDHIRNALQPILLVAGEAVPRDQQLKVIRESVDHIQWALTDVLPGDVASHRT